MRSFGRLDFFLSFAFIFFFFFSLFVAAMDCSVQ